MIALALLFAAQAQPADRTYEGDWYVSDTTNNNTGEREVYAFQLYLERPDYVTLTMRCTGGKPAFFVDWDKQTFPEVAVLSLGGATSPHNAPKMQRYVFEKSEEATEPGLRASPETSERIVAAIGNSLFLTLTAHLTYGDRTIVTEVSGTPRAWSRVSRHCPVRIMSRPPL